MLSQDAHICVRNLFILFYFHYLRSGCLNEFVFSAAWVGCYIIHGNEVEQQDKQLFEFQFLVFLILAFSKIKKIKKISGFKFLSILNIKGSFKQFAVVCSFLLDRNAVIPAN